MEIVDYGTYVIGMGVGTFEVRASRTYRYECYVLLGSGLNQNDTMIHCHTYAHIFIAKLFL